jgi:acyl-CoA thioesterase-1
VRLRSPFIPLLFLLLGTPTLLPAEEFQNPSREPRPFGTSGLPLTYLVMGDSTAAGQGAPYEQGIAVSTARELAKSRRVTMINLAVSGARTRDVLERQLPAARLLHPDLVLISIGANDVTHLTLIGAMRRNMLRIVDGLRADSPGVAIVITGSPDMGAPPRIPRFLRPIAGWRTRQVNRMFESIAARKHLGFAPIARTTGPLFRKDPTLFDGDRFHPNARGYATWLPALNQALERAAASR